MQLTMDGPRRHFEFVNAKFMIIFAFREVIIIVIINYILVVFG